MHPETYRAAHLSKSYYALDRAMRDIELQQGWERDNGPYEVRYREDGTPEIARAVRENDGHDCVDPGANVKTRARDGRSWTGDRPITEWVREGAPSLQVALGRQGSDWNDVRAALAAFNLELREKGNGFVVVDRTDERLVAKASHIGRFASRGRLEQQLGPFSRDEAGSRRVDDTRRLEYNLPLAIGLEADASASRSRRANRIVNDLPDRIQVVHNRTVSIGEIRRNARSGVRCEPRRVRASTVNSSGLALAAKNFRRRVLATRK